MQTVSLFLHTFAPPHHLVGEAQSRLASLTLTPPHHFIPLHLVLCTQGERSAMGCVHRLMCIRDASKVNTYGGIGLCYMVHLCISDARSAPLLQKSGIRLCCLIHSVNEKGSCAIHRRCKEMQLQFPTAVWGAYISLLHSSPTSWLSFGAKVVLLSMQHSCINSYANLL